MTYRVQARGLACSGRMEKMAVKNQVPWRSSLSLNLRDCEYPEQEQSDLFQNLEKLIASAVSICRLDGSLQCQIGGLITVIEELNRLLRHSFSEIKRLERTLDYQKQNLTGTISDLQKQLKDLQSNVGASNCSKSNVTSPVSMTLGDTPRSSLSEGNYTRQLATNGQQTNENNIGHVSLVDESYGNEDESDSSIPNNHDGQPEVQKDPEVLDVVSVGESTPVDHNINASDEAKEVWSDLPLNELESSQKIFDQPSENCSQETTDSSTLPNNQTIATSTTETTLKEELEIEVIPRILRNSKVTIESKNSQKVRTRSPGLVKSSRIKSKLDAQALVDKSRTMLSRANAQRRTAVKLVEKQRGTPKRPSHVNRLGIKGSTGNQVRQKNVLERKKANPKMRVTQRSRVSFGGKKIPKVKVEVRRKKDNTAKAEVINKTKSKHQLPGKDISSVKRTQKKNENRNVTSVTKATTPPPSPEKPMDKCINLDFLLMVNQVMSDLVSDSEREEAALDQVKESERKDVVRLAKLYRLRVRMAGKIEGELPVVLVKGRESCLPKPGEVDVLLSTMSLGSKRQSRQSRKTGSKHKIDVEPGNPHNKHAGSKSKKRRI